MSTDSPPNDKETRIRATKGALERVLTLARVLRAPGGCPWDRDQTVESLTPYLQEETYEVVEAVGSGNREAFREELGDLLFLVAFLALAGEDTGWGTVEDTANAVVDKLVRRHPHVFGTGPQLGSQGALRQWEEIKRAEKEPEGAVPSALGKRPAGLPALTSAFRISEKAGAVGFEWPDVTGALDKLDEEIGELRREVESGASREELEKELGDVLYSVVNISRYLKVDPERSLRTTTAKFIRRFRYVEEELHRRGKTPEKATLEEMDALWDEAKDKGIA
jgi:MazG family protein